MDSSGSHAVEQYSISLSKCSFLDFIFNLEGTEIINRSGIPRGCGFQPFYWEFSHNLFFWFSFKLSTDNAVVFDGFG